MLKFVVEDFHRTTTIDFSREVISEYNFSSALLLFYVNGSKILANSITQLDKEIPKKQVGAVLCY